MAISREQLIAQVSEQLEQKDFSGQMVNILRLATNNVLSRAKQSLDATLEEGTASRVDTVLQNIGNSMTIATQEWIDNTNGSLVIFPEGTRFVSKDAEKLVVVVELEPQVRRINYRGLQNDRITAVNHSFAVSLPYIQVIATFNRAGNDYNFNQHQLYMTTSKVPLRSLDQQVNRLVLPNTHHHAQICTGTMRNLPSANTTIVEKIQAIMSSYWQSEFNNDLNANFIWFLQNNNLIPADVTPTTAVLLTGLHAWQTASAGNPMFAIAEGTRYQVQSNFAALLPTDNSSRTSRVAVMNRLKQQITQNVTSIGGSVMQTVRDFNLVDENRDRPHIETMRQLYKSMVTHAYDNLWKDLNESHEQTKRQEEASQRARSREIAVEQANVRAAREQFDQERRAWLEEKNRREGQLATAHAYLQRKLGEVGTNMATASNPANLAQLVAVTRTAETAQAAPTQAAQTQVEVPNPPGYTGRGRPRNGGWTAGSIYRKRRRDGSYRVFVCDGRTWIEQPSEPAPAAGSGGPVGEFILSNGIRVQL